MTDDLTELRRHQEAALGVLARGVEKLEKGQAVMLAEAPVLREEMLAVLFGHQRFKHDRIYNPAIASGDEHRIALARHMKANCIAQGELLNGHMRRWTPDAIAADWPAYRIASRLTANQLRRHILSEGQSIEDLVAAYGSSQPNSLS